MGNKGAGRPDRAGDWRKKDKMTQRLEDSKPKQFSRPQRPESRFFSLHFPHPVEPCGEPLAGLKSGTGQAQEGLSVASTLRESQAVTSATNGSSPARGSGVSGQNAVVWKTSR